MGAAEQRAKDAAMASALLKRGIYHGKRITKPSKNSGGLTMVNAPGSSRAQRMGIQRSSRKATEAVKDYNVPATSFQHSHVFYDGTVLVVESDGANVTAYSTGKVRLKGARKNKAWRRRRENGGR